VELQMASSSFATQSRLSTAGRGRPHGIGADFD
jgi:hypothetical protein